jgi:class 3 adenylate cyclase
MAALMVGDIVGYSGLMERAEEQTADRLASCQALISEKVDLLDGRVFKTTGDGALAEFPSAVNAVRSAFEIRSALAGAQEPNTEPFRMRFGLHIADVVVQGDDLVGDGVNLAARIQAAAEPDSIYVSGALFDHVRRNSAFIFDDIGERAFKNITELVHLVAAIPSNGVRYHGKNQTFQTAFAGRDRALSGGSRGAAQVHRRPPPGVPQRALPSPS